MIFACLTSRYILEGMVVKCLVENSCFMKGTVGISSSFTGDFFYLYEKLLFVNKFCISLIQNEMFHL